MEAADAKRTKTEISNGPQAKNSQNKNTSSKEPFNNKPPYIWKVKSAINEVENFRFQIQKETVYEWQAWEVDNSENYWKIVGEIKWKYLYIRHLCIRGHCSGRESSVLQTQHF